MAFVRECVARYEIDCDLKWGYLHAAVKPGQSRALQTWGRHLQDAYDYRSLRYLPRDELRAVLASDSYHGAMRDSASGHLHPLNYCLGLARAAADAGARLHHNSGVQSVQPRGAKLRVQTARGAITCEQVVYAGNAYLGKLQPQLARMIMPVATCIIATERLGESAARALIANDAAVADTNFVLDYYRLSADNRMLFGGRVSYAAREPRRLTAALRRRMTRVFPQLTDARIDFAWGGYVAITRNRAPGIGQLAGGRGWFAHGFSGHGMALSGYAGRLLAAAITGERADMDAFTRIPHANFPGGAMLRMPALVAAMSYRIMRDRLAR